MSQFKDYYDYAPGDVNKDHYLEFCSNLLKGSLPARYPADKSKDDFKYLLTHCQAAKINPMRDKIYCMYFGGKLSLIVGIHTLWNIAERTGLTAGCEDIKFTYDEEGKLISATSTIYKVQEKLGIRVSYSATAHFDEYNSPRSPMWKKAHIMLGKCADSLCLRKAFPNFAGWYTQEEMEQAKDEN